MPLTTPPQPPPTPADSSITHFPGPVNFCSADGYCSWPLAILAVFIVYHLVAASRFFVGRNRRTHTHNSQWNRQLPEKLPSYTTWTKPSALPYQQQHLHLQFEPAGVAMDDTLREVVVGAETPAFESLPINAGVRSASLPPMPTMPYPEVEYRFDSAGWRFGRHLPPPPPLTPPSLAPIPFPLDDSRLEHNTSPIDRFDISSEDSFIHQPNPDYTAELDGSEVAAPPSPFPSPRRRNYTRLVPVGNPVLPSTEQEETDGLADPSYPPSPDQFINQPGQPGTTGTFEDGDTAREIGLRGEIISTLDDAGAGWKRHTRVYGGGVCLACLAAEGGNGFSAVAGQPRKL